MQLEIVALYVLGALFVGWKLREQKILRDLNCLVNRAERWVGLGLKAYQSAAASDTHRSAVNAADALRRTLETVVKDSLNKVLNDMAKARQEARQENAHNRKP